MGDRWGKGRKGSSEWKALLPRSLQSEPRGDLRGEWPQHCSMCVLGAELAYSQWQESLCRNRKRRLQTLLASVLAVKGSTRMAGLRSPAGTIHGKACRGTGWVGLYQNDKWDLRGLRGIHHTVHHTHTSGAPPARRKLTSWNLGSFVTVLQRLHLDTPLLEQQNAKKLYQTKKEQCGYTVGANSGRKIQNHQNKTKQKEPLLPLLKSQEQKQGTE